MNLLLTFAVVFGLYGHVVDSQFTEDCNDNSQCGAVSGIYMCRSSTGNGYNLYSCNDLNQCKTTPTSCKLRGKCTGSECTCSSGFTGDMCSADIDECADGNHCLNGTCMNTVGGFNCTCNSGYQLVNDNTNCIDIDECERLGICPNGGCNNTAGGFYCTCKSGFHSINNHTSCADVDECNNPKTKCPHGQCNNTVGGFTCTCDTGFTKEPNSSSCIPISGNTKEPNHRILQTSDSQSTNMTMAESSTSSAAVGGPLPAISVLIVPIVVAFVAVILWRRRVRKQPSHNDPIPTETTQSNITPSQSSEREYESSLPSTRVVGSGRLGGAFNYVVSKVKSAIPVKQRRETANAPVYAVVNKFKKAKHLESANSIDSAVGSAGPDEPRVYMLPTQQSSETTDETTAYDVLGQRRPVNPSPPDVTYCHLNMALEN